MEYSILNNLYPYLYTYNLYLVIVCSYDGERGLFNLRKVKFFLFLIFEIGLNDLC